MLVLTQGFDEKCNDAHVFLDTNVFINAAQQEELLIKLAGLASNGTVLITISSVVYEYTRGSQSLAEFNTRREFINGLTSRVMPVGKFLESERLDPFSVAMSLVIKKGDSQYTDYMLASALYQFMGTPGHNFVLSADARAFPLDIFDIEGVITIDSAGKLCHLYLISLSADKYGSLATTLKKSGRI